MNKKINWKPIFENDYIKISLSKSKYFTIIDSEDLHLVSKINWFHVYKGNNHYAYNNSYKKKLIMHRIIMNISNPKIQVDHINGNGLDNRKVNLRLCTQAQNLQNKKIINKYKGIWECKNRNGFTSYIGCNGVRHYLGHYKTRKEAAKAYDKAAIKYFGEFACLNFPKENYET